VAGKVDWKPSRPAPPSPPRPPAWLGSIPIATRPFAPLPASIVERAIELSVTWRIPCRDGGSLAAAEALGPASLFTEDFQGRQLFGAVRAADPFAGL
jgi:hypothetical protein